MEGGIEIIVRYYCFIEKHERKRLVYVRNRHKDTEISQWKKQCKIFYYTETRTIYGLQA